MSFFFQSSSPSSSQKITLPNSLLNPLFGKVSYERVASNLEVMFTILMPRIGEGWQTGVALDASVSMQSAYGQKLTGEIPPNVQKEYRRKGWLYQAQRDSDRQTVLKSQAYQDAIAKGYLQWTPNIVQAECRTFIQYLAERLDADGETSVIYWACGQGEEIEVLGDIRATECMALVINGPKKASYGSKTKLLPALRYFVDRFVDAHHGMYIFITDGRLEDMASVKSYCVELAQRIQSGQRNPLKCVLIGMGSQIDQQQMTELDNLETGTDIDLWDYKIAADMRQVTEIFAELVDDSVTVAPVASIYDDQDNLIERFTDGLPARVKFSLPQTSQFFELEVPGQARIRQPLSG